MHHCSLKPPDFRTSANFVCSAWNFSFVRPPRSLRLQSFGCRIIPFLLLTFPPLAGAHTSHSANLFAECRLADLPKKTLGWQQIKRITALCRQRDRPILVSGRRRIHSLVLFSEFFVDLHLLAHQTTGCSVCCTGGGFVLAAS